jgi:outer membrane receptor protein involved in Fe transport
VLGGALRNSERLTFEQTIPTRFATASGQWTRGTSEQVWLFGTEFKRARGNQDEIRYSVAGVPSGPFPSGGTETSGAMFARVSLTPRDPLTIVIGVRGDFWQSTPADDTSSTHSAQFFSPRVSAAWRVSSITSAHASVYRAHRTPTLNELHRRFAVGNTVTNANPLLDPEHLTGFDGGALFAWGQLSARVTGFWNELDGAITNVTITPPPVPGQITRQRQNTDTVRARGLEVEADFRPFPQWTFSALAGVTRSTFVEAPAQPALVDKRVPQVPSYQLGATVTYVDPIGFTGSLQARRIGTQFDDDLNLFTLEPFGVVDLFLGQQVMRGLHVFAAIENLGDVDYDVGRTPIRTIGWPRTVRIGLRVFLP